MNALLDKQPDPADFSLLRFMTSAARPLKRDPKLTALGAFDTLQKIHRKYERHWWSLWIVCNDGYCDVTPSMSVGEAIRRIEQHKGAAGIVGLAVIARKFTFLKKPLRVDDPKYKGPKVSELLDASGNASAERFLEITEAYVKASKAAL
jgi:hypothetical protein